MNNHIKIIENFLSTDECNYILSKCKKELELSEAKVTNGNNKIRKSSVGWIDEINCVNEKLTDLLKTSYNINGIEVTGLGSFQFTEYKVGEYFDWHIDRVGEIYKDRFVSTVILLNDNYNGGVLEILDNNGNKIPTNQKVGNLYIFDSGLRHRVTSVELGTRYSLVNWVSIVKTNLTKKNLI
jgi:predicted 2-oxoglutarate/Fe(II)-dependent dioxygenase YbiX